MNLPRYFFDWSIITKQPLLGSWPDPDHPCRVYFGIMTGWLIPYITTQWKKKKTHFHLCDVHWEQLHLPWRADTRVINLKELILNEVCNLKMSKYSSKKNKKQDSWEHVKGYLRNVWKNSDNMALYVRVHSIPIIFHTRGIKKERAEVGSHVEQELN